MLPHTDDKGGKKLHRLMEDLDEMQSYLNPEMKIETVKSKATAKLKTRQKMAEVFSFLKDCG
jgi:hypothetical protein